MHFLLGAFPTIAFAKPARYLCVVENTYMYHGDDLLRKIWFVFRARMDEANKKEKSGAFKKKRLCLVGAGNYYMYL